MSPARRDSCIPAIALLLTLASFASPARAQCPPAPVANPAISAGFCNVVLTWLPPPGGGALNYFVYRGTSTVFAEATLVGATSLLSYIDTPPARRQAYSYWVRSMPNPAQCVQTGGLASFGEIVYARMPEPTVTALGCATLNITWPLLRDASTYDVARYYQSFSGDYVLDKYLATDLPGPPMFDSSGVPGTQYFYAVFAYGSCAQPTSALLSEAYFPGVPRPSVTGASAVVGGTVQLTASADVSPLAASFRWSRNGAPLSNSAKYQGVDQGTLQIAALTQADEGAYTVRVSTPCGEDTQTAILAVHQACPADFNGSGAISVQDIFDFLAAYFAGCP
jgi:hypothetical protein